MAKKTMRIQCESSSTDKESTGRQLSQLDKNRGDEEWNRVDVKEKSRIDR